MALAVAGWALPSAGAASTTHRPTSATHRAAATRRHTSDRHRDRAARRHAVSVLVLTGNGRVQRRTDPYLAPNPADAGPGTTPRAARRPRSLRAVAAAAPTVPQVLSQLLSSGQISSADDTTDTRIWNKGVAALPTLTGTPATEFGAVMSQAETFAATGLMTPSRLDEMFTTLWRNRVWWTTGVVPSVGQRIEFSGSQIVWEYYPGQGLQLQVLGTFGAADGLYTAGPNHYSQMLSLVNEMLPMAATRDGDLAWEYLFAFQTGNPAVTGTPPWTSAMSQGTAIEALTRASRAATALGDTADAATYLSTAHQALAILGLAPPQGVAVPTSRGTRFVLYSFNPSEAVINGFLQTLIGVDDYGQASGDAQAKALFAAGNAEAEYELPSYDTGAWSLYEPGQEDDLSYHQLVTGFLQQLCQRTHTPIYCTTYSHFNADLTTRPVVKPLTTAIAAGTAAPFSLALSKISQVTVTVTNPAQQVVARVSVQEPYGTDSVTLPSLSAGADTVTVAATDLAGNAATATGPLTVH